MISSFFHTFACLSGATSVILSAYGHHALKGRSSFRESCPHRRKSAGDKKLPVARVLEREGKADNASHFEFAEASSWDKAILYQLIHSVALLSISSSPSFVASLTKSKGLGGSGFPPSDSKTSYHNFAGGAFITGIGLFSGSIYGLCLTKEGHAIRKVLGPATPIGGLAFIAGWLALALAGA